MPKIRVALWNIEDDVLEAFASTYHKDYVTVIAASGYAPPVGSIVICGHSFFAPIGRICALGKVYRKQTVATARVRSRIQPLYLLEHPIGSEKLEEYVARHFDHHVNRALQEGIGSFDLYPKLFTERSSLEIMEAIRDASDEASAILDRLLTELPVLPDLDEFRLQEERDAVSTAIRFASLSQTAYPRPSSGSSSNQACHSEYPSRHTISTMKMI